jgi:DNA polymerase III alpha subunit (gram-positive type)
MYLAFDSETGGLGNDVSLLTVYFAVFDKEFNLVSDLDLKLIPDDGIYRVQPKALEINKIDLAKLGQEAITYKDAKTQLYNFLQLAKYRDDIDALVPLGQNVQFDIEKIVDTIISKGSWDNFVSRRVLDTMIIANFLKQIGLLNIESVSLGSLVEYFGIKIDGVAHEAKYDTLATVEVYKKLRWLVKEPTMVSGGWY